MPSGKEEPYPAPAVTLTTLSGAIGPKTRKRLAPPQAAVGVLSLGPAWQFASQGERAGHQTVLAYEDMKPGWRSPASRRRTQHGHDLLAAEGWGPHWGLAACPCHPTGPVTHVAICGRPAPGGWRPWHRRLGLEQVVRGRRAQVGRAGRPGQSCSVLCGARCPAGQEGAPCPVAGPGRLAGRKNGPSCVPQRLIPEHRAGAWGWERCRAGPHPGRPQQGMAPDRACRTPSWSLCPGLAGRPSSHLWPLCTWDGAAGTLVPRAVWVKGPGRPGRLFSVGSVLAPPGQPLPSCCLCAIVRPWAPGA